MLHIYILYIYTLAARMRVPDQMRNIHTGKGAWGVERGVK
jgi:hypothetical protein